MVHHSRSTSKVGETSGTSTTDTPGETQHGAQVPTVMGPLLHDSMVTVRLSEPSLVAIQSYGSDIQATDNRLCLADGADGEVKAIVIRGSIMKTADEMDDSDKDTIYESSSSIGVAGVSVSNSMATDTAATTAHTFTPATTGERRTSDEVSGVNWEALERTEEQEPRNQDTEDVSTLRRAS